MGSSTQPKLPVIDLSSKNLNLNSSSWLTKCNEVRLALEDYGGFIATYDGVSQELHDEIYRVSQDLFNLPSEVKALNVVDSPAGGYIPPKATVAESLGILHPNNRNEVENFTKLMWPSGNQAFCESTWMYSKAITELYEKVAKMLSKSYGIEEHYESFHGSANYLLKFIKCRGEQENEKTTGMYRHTDKDFMTLLYQRDIKGLEILTKDGEWIEVEYPPSSFVIVAGDGLMAWTNGRIEAPTHRVMMTGNKERLSLAVAVYIKDHMIQIPQELVDENHPLQFRAFDNFKYMCYSIDNEDIVKSPEWSIKSYCGIGSIR